MSNKILTILHDEIDICEVCACKGLVIKKSVKLIRGELGAKVMVVGIAPSKAAITSGKAFAGNSFSRLGQWFSDAGFSASEAQLRKAIYFTSLNKCAVVPDTMVNRKLLWSHCQQFLWRQIQVLKPELILLLGMEVAKTIFSNDGYSKLKLGMAFKSDDIFQQQLFPPVVQAASWLLIPHPSGLNRAMNDSSVRAKVIASMKRELKKIEFVCPS